MRTLTSLVIAAAALGACSEDVAPSATPVERVFLYNYSGSSLPLPQRCDVDGVCPDGQTCYRLTPDIAVCDKPQWPVATTCSWDTDECECTGRTCPAGTTCSTTLQSAHSYNVCLPPPCASPTDCTGESVCTPESLIFPVGPCFTPRCTRDVVCSRGAEGRCALVLQDGQFGGRSLQKVGCVYAGDFREATACNPDDATALRGNSTSPPWPAYYTCPEPWPTQ
jgi:hypothetical protein